MRPTWLGRRVAAPGPCLTLVTSQDEFDAVLRHFKMPLGTPYMSSARADATAHFFDDQRGDSVAVVALGDTTGRSGVEIAGLLVHEAVHIWQTHRENIGETHPGREQEAYAVQGIAQELMAEYARRIVRRPGAARKGTQ